MPDSSPLDERNRSPNGVRRRVTKRSAVTILDLFDAAVADRTDRPALDDLSYAELRRRTLRAAKYLRERGIERGERVSLYCENRHAYVYAYLGALRLGAIAVPTNVLYRAADLRHVVENARVRAILVSEQTREHAGGLGGGYDLIDAGELERACAEPGEAELELPRMQPDEVAWIIYTSGTTGRAKGAMLTHDNVASIAMQLVTAWRWRAEDRLLLTLPLFHLHGLGAGLNGTLTAGAHVLLEERFDAERARKRMREDGVTMFFGVPTMYVRLLEAADGDDRFPAMRLFVSGSAALSADVHRGFEATYGATILERYGATEFGFALGNRYAGPRVAGSVGTTFPGTRVRVADPLTGDAVAPGAEGELYVNAPTVFAGYWEAPDATAAAFAIDANGTRWFRSGDLARYDPQQDVYEIVGRLKELIISGGFNVYPREIETEIDRFPGVRASAVVAGPDYARGEVPVAFVETEETIDAESLRAVLAERLASFKVPKAIHIIDALPRNAMGKIEKAKLRERLQAAAREQSPT